MQRRQINSSDDIKRGQMKTALDCYGRGKQKECDADEYEVGSFYSRERFICPECGEFVHLTRGKYSNCFAHYKRKNMTVECDRRIDGVLTDSIYERIGLPIYLRHGAVKGTFELSLGFKALPRSLMEDAEKSKLQVSIDGESSYLVNRERFSEESTVLIPIQHIPICEKRYHLSYSPVDKAAHIMKHWADYADGFSSHGAFFTISEQGGRKIHHGDNISTDIEYYWVKKDDTIPMISGLKGNRIGILQLKKEKWYIYKVILSSDISDRAFEYLAFYLREYLQLYLLEKEPKYIPIWPPLVKQEDEYLVDGINTKVYGCVMSGNDEPKTYIYNGVLAIPRENNYKDKMLAVNIDSNDILINIDRKYVSSGTRFRQAVYELSSETTLMKLEYNSDVLKIDHKMVELDSIPDKIVGTENKTMLIAKPDGEIQMIKNKELEVDASCFKHGQTIYVLSFKSLNTIIKIKNENGANVGCDEESLLKYIVIFGNAVQSFIPIDLRTQLLNMEWRNRKVRQYMFKCIRQNKISTPLIQILEGMLNETI